MSSVFRRRTIVSYEEQTDQKCKVLRGKERELGKDFVFAKGDEDERVTREEKRRENVTTVFDRAMASFGSSFY